MKLFICVFFFPFLILNAYADRYHSRIQSIERGEGKEPHLLLLMDGHVAFVEQTSQSTLKALQQTLETGDDVEVEVDGEQNLISVQSVDPIIDEVGDGEEVGTKQNFEYTPSIVSSYSGARSIFQNMRRDYQDDSQCYNRAHVWAFEEFNRSGLNSMKLFLFFTSRYIRNYRYPWWFHVTPMVHVQEGASVVWRTLDRRYTASPLGLKTWTDLFIKSKRACPVIYKYSDYRNHQQEQDCYLAPVSQYFWQPRDILRYENTGYQKKSFINSEVNHAYWEAF